MIPPFQPKYREYENISFNELEIEVMKYSGPLSWGLEDFAAFGLKPVTAKEFALLKMLAGFEHDLRKTGSLLTENINYWPNGDILITSPEHNVLLKNPKDATVAHEKGKEYYLDDAIVKELRNRVQADPEKAIKTGALFISRKDFTEWKSESYGYQGYQIAFTEFGSHPLMQFLGWNQKFGEWLEELQKRSVEDFNSRFSTQKEANPYFEVTFVSLADTQKEEQAFVRPLEFTPELFQIGHALSCEGWLAVGMEIPDYNEDYIHILGTRTIHRRNINSQQN